MPEWAAFAGFVGVVLVSLLVLARLSTTTFDAPDFPATLSDRVVGTSTTPSPAVRRPATLSTPTLLANVVISQGAFASILVVGTWLTGVPAAALGLAADAFARPDLLGGVALGVGLHAVNAVGSRLTDRFELGDPERLRRAMTPETAAGWVGLLGVVLPLVAGFEELLFRGVLIGAFAVGFELSPWLLAALSSVAFALGHGAQGRLGIVVSGALGFVLAVAFVVTDSLVTVVVAHYLVNAMEFVGNGR